MVEKRPFGDPGGRHDGIDGQPFQSEVLGQHQPGLDEVGTRLLRGRHPFVAHLRRHVLPSPCPTLADSPSLIDRPTGQRKGATMPTIQTSLGTISYRDDGAGPPVLLLHAALHDRTDYAPVHDALVAGRRVLALDWPGHGESPTPDTPLRAVQFSDVLKEFVESLDLRDLVLVGNSVGGYAACRLAIEHPERVAGLVLVNSGGFTPHSAVTRAFCAVMGRPAVVKAVFPLFVRAYMHAKTPMDKTIVDRVVAQAKSP